MPPTDDDDRTPITMGTLSRRATLVSTVVAGLITITLWLANMRTDIASLKQQASYQESRLIQLEGHGSQTDKSIADLTQKLDRAVTVLERIDKKLGQP
jgi:hypothetical protein